MVTGTEIASPSGPLTPPRVPANLASAHFASLHSGLSRSRTRSTFSRHRFELRVSSGRAVVSECPEDRSGSSDCGALDAPSRIDDERRPGLRSSVARLPTMRFWQPASIRYPPLKSAESSDARPLPAMTLTAALGPFFPRRASPTLRFTSENSSFQHSSTTAHSNLNL